MPSPPPPFDLDLLRTFVAIVDCKGFTRAAERLGRTQSTISLQIKRLEDGIGRRVFEREGRSVGLTTEGEVLLTYARQVLKLTDEVRVRIMEPDVEGHVRLGTPEDFATVHLPEVLARFARAHPQVTLSVNCDFTLNLLEGFSKGEYDLILCKREPQGPSGGVNVWREPLVWAASRRLVLDASHPIPLVLAPYPDVYRKRAQSALDKMGRPWEIVYSSPSLAGLQAAVRAGLGITVLSKEMVPSDFVTPALDFELPELADTEIALYRAPDGVSKAAEMLAQDIIHALEGEARGLRGMEDLS